MPSCGILDNMTFFFFNPSYRVVLRLQFPGIRGEQPAACLGNVVACLGSVQFPTIKL